MTQNSRTTACCTTASALCFWAAAFAVLYGAGLLLQYLVPSLRGYSGAVLFVALGLACLANFARNRTFHCAITGPFFLLMALLVAFASAWFRALPGSVVWAAILIVSGIAFLLEWRYARRAS